MKRRYVGTGEMLAIEAGALQRGVEGLFWLMSDDPITGNRRHGTHGDVSIVTIRGSLEHHLTSGSDSYDAIRERAKLAFEGKDVEEGEAPSPPTAVILDIDSRGGVVAGLNECVADLQAMRRAYGIPLIAVLNEMAASAAFAIACAADKRYCPASGIVGSIGTISTMVSQAAKDASDGIDVRLLTSGARKADGHPHAPISDVAVKAEQGRVDALANAFFRLAGKSLGVSPAKLQALQAAIYLGPDAKKHGLVDDVRSLDQVAATLTRPPTEGAESKGNETRREAGPHDAAGQRAAAISPQAPQKPLDAARRSASRCKPMKLIARLGMIAALMAGETDPTKRSKLIRLSASKSQALATSAEKGDDDPEDDEDEDDDEDESKSSKAAKKAEAAKKAAKAAGHRAKAAEFKKKAEEAEEAAQAAEADDEEAEEAAARNYAGAAHAAAPNAPTAGALAALTEKAAAYDKLAPRLASLETVQVNATKNALVQEAVAKRCITRHQAIALEKKDLTFVKDYLAMHTKPLVNIDESALLNPDTTPAADLPANIRAIVEQAVTAKGLQGAEADKFRENSYAAHRKALTNGAGVTH